MGERKRVEEGKIKERCEIGDPSTEIPGDRKEGEVRSPDELGERECLLPFLFLVEDLDRVAVEHDEQDIDPVGEGRVRARSAVVAARMMKSPSADGGETSPAGIGRVPKSRQYFVSFRIPRLSDQTPGRYNR